MEQPDAARVKSAERVFDVLEQVMAAPGGSSFPDLSRSLGIPKSSLHALLSVMERRQYLEIDPVSRKIRLGLRVLEAGQACLQAQSLIGTAQPVMAALVAGVNETAQLARLSGRENVYLAREDSSHALRLQSQPGVRLPAHATGLGKAILAQQSDTAVSALYADARFERFTDQTLGSLPDLLAELRETRLRGFAIDNEEFTAGLFCLAVPVAEPGKPLSAALSLSVPVSRATVAGLSEMLWRLARAAQEISARLGASAPDAALAALGQPETAANRLRDLAASGRYPLRFS